MDVLNQMFKVFMHGSPRTPVAAFLLQKDANAWSAEQNWREAVGGNGEVYFVVEPSSINPELLNPSVNSPSVLPTVPDDSGTRLLGGT